MTQNCTQAIHMYSAAFIKPEALSLCPKKPTNAAYAEPDESSLQLHTSLVLQHAQRQ